MGRARSTPIALAAWFLVGNLVVGGPGCKSSDTEHLDDEAREEIDDCPRTPEAAEPPPGRYVDRGLAIDYDRAAPFFADRHQFDRPYAMALTLDADALEQIYHDATHGNRHAMLFVCGFEIAARHTGRVAARHLDSLECLTFYSCDVRFEKLPYSEETRSGLRVRAEIARAFETEGFQQGLTRELIGNALAVFVGTRALAGMKAAAPARGPPARAAAPTRPAPAQTRPKPAAPRPAAAADSPSPPKRPANPRPDLTPEQIWRMKPLQRGQIIEDRLARTVYKDWWHIGREQRGKFPLVDFQRGNRLVSVKTVNPASPTAAQRMEQHIIELHNRKFFVEGQRARIGLDIRVPRGSDTSALQHLKKYGRENQVTVTINEF